MKKLFFIGTLLLLSGIAQAELYPSIHDDKKVEASEFDCSNNVNHLIPYLGRGPDFPAFLIQDIESELQRQGLSGHLIKIDCIDEAQLVMSGKPVEGNDKQANISTLSITFLLKIEVGSTSNAMSFEVDQNYTVENLGSTSPTLTQNFTVK